MLILLILILLIILIILLYQSFRLIKWIIKKEIRIKWASVLVGVIVLAILINHLFFKSMKFIPSKVYPDLYIVKYLIEDKDSLHKVIEKIVLQKVNNQLKTPFENVTVPYRISFYEYYNGTSFLIPFGEAGTTHFIEHKEDPGGFSSEELSHYSQYLMAEFNLEFCKNDTLNYIGTVTYYEKGERIKTVSLINQCEIKSMVEPSEIVFETD